MKKILGILAIAGVLTACNNSADTKDNMKDSLDSVANLKKDMIDSTKNKVDSSADAQKNKIDSTTEAKKDKIDSTHK